MDIGYDIALDAYYDQKEERKRQIWGMTFEILNELTDESVVEEIQATSEEAHKEQRDLQQEEFKEESEGGSPRTVSDLEKLIARAALGEMMGNSTVAIGNSVGNARRRRAAKKKMKKSGMCGFRVCIQRGKYGGRSGNVDQSQGSKWLIILDDGTEVVESLSNVTLL